MCNYAPDLFTMCTKCRSLKLYPIATPGDAVDKMLFFYKCDNCDEIMQLQPPRIKTRTTEHKPWKIKNLH